MRPAAACVCVAAAPLAANRAKRNSLLLRETLCAFGTFVMNKIHPHPPALPVRGDCHDYWGGGSITVPV